MLLIAGRVLVLVDILPYLTILVSTCLPCLGAATQGLVWLGTKQPTRILPTNLVHLTCLVMSVILLLQDTWRDTRRVL